jgi:hypothetical protein
VNAVSGVVGVNEPSFLTIRDRMQGVELALRTPLIDAARAAQSPILWTKIEIKIELTASVRDRDRAWKLDLEKTAGQTLTRVLKPIIVWLGQDGSG